jgi:hypothetical protein
LHSVLAIEVIVVAPADTLLPGAPNPYPLLLARLVFYERG